MSFFNSQRTIVTHDKSIYNVALECTTYGDKGEVFDAGRLREKIAQLKKESGRPVNTSYSSYRNDRSRWYIEAIAFLEEIYHYGFDSPNKRVDRIEIVCKNR